MSNDAHSMKAHESLLTGETQRDASFGAEWDALELARVVAAEVIRYRARHRLTQRALAERLGVKQPQIARLESGEHVPQFRTLMMLSHRLEVEFMIDIAPARRTPRFVTKRTREAHSVKESSGVTIVVASDSFTPGSSPVSRSPSSPLRRTSRSTP
jgi:DNA-binding XRE family transcriptional regulator